MFNKFINGLIFGSGFAIAFTIIAYLGLTFLTNVKFNEQSHSVSRSSATTKTPPQQHIKAPIPFHELSLEDKIKASSVIALMRYEKSPNGESKTIIKEFLKKEKNTTIYYKVGDEYKNSHYPKSQKLYGDGVITFFQGSPAKMRFSTTYHGDRIGGLSDLPIELLREKCK